MKFNIRNMLFVWYIDIFLRYVKVLIWMKTNIMLRAAALSAAGNPGFRSCDLCDIKPRQLPCMAQQRLEQNWIESSPANFKACGASVLQLVPGKNWQEFSFHIFPFKNEARKRQWQVATNRWDLATKKLWEPKQFKRNASQIAHCWAFSLGSNTCL